MKKKYNTPQEYLEVRKSFPSYSKRYGSRKREFIAYDGEGVTQDGVHRYALLGNSKGCTLEEYETGISTREAFRWLLDQHDEFPKSIAVMFGMNYDVNMMLNGIFRDVSYNHVKMLQRNNRVFWNEFQITYVPRRYITISEYDKPHIDKRNTLPLRSVTLWDCLRFFQCSFLEALRGMFTPEELDDMNINMIEEQKLRRGEFTNDDLESGLVLKYNLVECDALVKLMTRFKKNCDDIGVQLKRYDGAGSLASSMLQKYGIGDITQKSVNMLTSKENEGLMDAIRVAYGGGRTEMFKYGHTDKKVYHYDIIGAFPDRMPGLPDLSDGTWVHKVLEKGSRKNVESFSLFKIYWDYRNTTSQDRIFPFFYRLPWGEARIQYPPQGYTWVWAPELFAAISKEALKCLCGIPKVVESWSFIPNNDNRPFSFVRDMCDKRIEYKRQGNKSQATAIKLALNAIPGKMAQTQGYSGGERGVRSSDIKSFPPYFNLAYAGYITSGVRARIFLAAIQHPEDIIAIATDGIWSLVPLDLPIGDNVGDWTFEELDGFTSIQPGVYFTKKSDGTGVHHYRGFNEGSLDENLVIETWKNKGYTVPVKVRRFVTMGTLLSESDYMEKWCTWREEDRILDIQQGMSTKRLPILYEGFYDYDAIEDFPTDRAASSLVSTYASQVDRLEEGVTRYSSTDKWGISIEEYLSKKHYVPWLEPSKEVTKRQQELNQSESIAWEIIDTDI